MKFLIKTLEIFMVNISTGVAGFEPTRKGVKVLCLTAWLYPNSDLCNNKGLLLGEYK